MMSTVQAQSLINLVPFEWSNRLILINTQTPYLGALQKKLKEHTHEIDDRHIVWFILSGNQVISNYQGKINDDFSHSIRKLWFPRQNTDLEVVLIGKDGREKWRNQVLDLPGIFGAIDVMPMRRYEMKNQ